MGHFWEDLRVLIRSFVSKLDRNLPVDNPPPPWRPRRVGRQLWQDVRAFVHQVEGFLDVYLPTDPPPAPAGPPVIRAKRQLPRSSNSMAKQFGYTIDPPPLAADTDVTERRLHVVVDGGDPVVHPAPVGQPWPEIVVAENANVTLTATDFDGVNESAPSPALTFTAIDDVPPDVPGAPTVEKHRQIFSAVVPDVTPPPPDVTTPPAP